LDGDFFNKVGAFKNITTFDALKKAIVREFRPKNEKRTCNLPKNLEDSYLTDEVMNKLLDDVHTIFFEKRKDLVKAGESPVEVWQTFILLFYVFQKNDLKFRLGNVTHYTTACKDFLDRGGCMALIEERLHDFMLEQENDLKLQQKRLVNTLAPAILVKKTNVIQARLKLALTVDKHLCSLSKEQKKLLRDYRIGDKKWKGVGLDVEEHPNQVTWK
jgi:hypothetical protein